MLPKQHRLKKRGDFDRAHRKGKPFRGRFLAAKVVVNGGEHSRFGYMVSKKVNKRAVVRGRIRRRLREATRALLPNLKQGLDVVVMTRPESADKTFEELKAELETTFRKARLFKDQT